MKRKLSILCAVMFLLQTIFSVIPVLAENETTEAYTELESPSVTYNMNIDWKYKRAADNAVFPLATALEGVKDANGNYFYETDYDDSDWEKVSLPHAVNAEDSFDGAGLDAGEASLYRGFMFYRKTFDVPESDIGKKMILEFEAFRQSVYVYVNGTMVGYYEAGIAPVGFDISDYITSPTGNVIAVATDNASDRGATFSTKETIPGNTPGDESGVGYQWNTKDFNEVQGGLTGNVKLYATSKIYQTLPLYNNLKTTGNYIYGSNFDLRNESADVTVEAEVRNETGEAKDITLQVDIVDKDGNLVATFEETQNVAAATDTENDQFLTMVPDTAYVNGEGQETNNVDISTVEVTKITATQNVSDLKFWSDVSPNLYTVYTYLKDGDIVIDKQEKVTGFREVTYDKDKGLQINGQTTYLKGYAQRSTNEWAAIGVANDWLSDIDMQLIKESNANYIRWMHIAPNPVDIRAGDKYGVISVCPAGDKEADASGRAWDQRAETMRDVIIYYRNSPSVLFYEAGNNQISAEHMQEMTDLRKALDPNGDRMMGCRTINSPEQIAAAEWVGTMLYRNDAAAYSAMEQTGNYIPMLETEYHRNEAPRRVWDDYSPPYYDYVNKWLGDGGKKTDGYDVWDQTQEDFSRTMFNSGDGYSYYYGNRVGGSGKNYYSGAAMMVWSDSNMHVRNCGVENARTSGRVDPIRVKKESFYAIQAAQSTEPMIHILGHWNYPEYIEGDQENGNYWYEDKTFNGTYWEPNGTMLQRDPTTKTVYVIGSESVSKVELYVNDKLVGTDTTPTDGYIYAFDNIDVTQSGKVSAKAYNEREEVVAEHEIKTAGEAATIRLTPVKGPDGFLADGSDLMYVDVEVVDEEGNVCPLDERKITFTVSDESKATFLGGYNSGVDDRIVNHKDYVFAECGINRVFLQATRDAGSFTLTASAEGMAPVTINLESTAIELTGGLTTDAQQSFAQGEVPEPPKQETAPALKSLGETFTADFTEGTGNVYVASEDEKDYYTIKVNGKEVNFTDKSYKPDSITGVVGEVGPILDAIKAAGGDVSYSFNTSGELPPELSATNIGGILPWMSITSGENVVLAANNATNVIINGEPNLTNFMVIPNSANTTLIAELSSVLGSIEGIEVSTNEDTKVMDIAVDGYSGPSIPDGVSMAYNEEDNKITVTTTDEGISNAALIQAGYDSNGVLKKIVKTDVTVAANSIGQFDVDADVFANENVKAMLWTDMSNAAAICDAVPIKSVTQAVTVSLMADEPVVDKVYENDEVAYTNDCNTETENLVLSSDTAPDGSKYLTNESYNLDGSGGYKGYAFAGLSDNSKADILWETDIRFNADGAGITPFSKDNGKLGTCVRRYDGDGTPKLAIQTGGSSFTKYIDIDPAKWYHIALIGRYSSADAQTDMIVYEYNGSEKTYIATYENVNQRNLGKNSNNGASHFNINPGTSVDNVQITMLGADTLNVSSDSDTIKAGNTMQFDYGATRQGAYITSPAVTWEVYNSDNTELLNDPEITINSGILNVGINATKQDIYVRATAESGIYASKKISVDAVDVSSVKFDTLELTADRDYVSTTEPLTINVKATKEGEVVDITDSDLIWYATDSTDMQKLGDDLKWIKIENGKVTVDEKAVSQDITIRAADPDDIVRGAIKVHIKSSDALEGNEDGAMDRLLVSDNCESILANTEFVESVDGTHAYKATAGYPTGHITETSGDVVVEMDIKFAQDGAGFQPAKNGKLNTCVIYHEGKLCVQTGSSSFDKYVDIDPNKWYHITLIRKQESYAHIILDEYDDEGNIVNTNVFRDVNQRNDEPTAFVNINPGTCYDNLRMLTPVPDSITISTDKQSVFVGETAQATANLYWNELEMKNPDASMFEYRVYDAEDKYPLESDKITVDGTGLITVDPMADAQDVYIRAVAKQSGKYASTKLTVSSSDILMIDSLGINEDGTRLVNMNVTRNLFYKDEVTFVTQVFDENGAVKMTSTKEMLGTALRTGTNKVSLGIDLPEDFDKTTDTIKIYAVTKLYTDDVTAPDGTLAASKTDGGIQLGTVPAYDEGTDAYVLVIKAEADETKLTDDDILFFDEVNNLQSGYVAKWTQDYTGGYTVKTAGKINGTLTISAASVE